MHCRLMSLDLRLGLLKLSGKHDNAGDEVELEVLEQEIPKGSRPDRNLHTKYAADRAESRHSAKNIKKAHE